MKNAEIDGGNEGGKEGMKARNEGERGKANKGGKEGEGEGKNDWREGRRFVDWRNFEELQCGGKVIGMRGKGNLCITVFFR